jgi:hypothetical protein
LFKRMERLVVVSGAGRERRSRLHQPQRSEQHLSRSGALGWQFAGWPHQRRLRYASAMPDWRVSLGGQQADLARLADIPGDGWSVSVQEGVYYLRSATFQAILEARAVQEAARVLVEPLSGALALNREAIGRVAVGGVELLRGDGTRAYTVFPEPVTIRIEVGKPTIRVVGSTTPAPERRHPIAVWTRVALGHEGVAKALRLFRKDASWDDLYRVFEVIEGDVGGGMYERGWVSRSAVRRFTATANSPAVLGDRARHGSQRGQPPPDPMTLREAHELVERLVVRWVEEKGA